MDKDKKRFNQYLHRPFNVMGVELDQIGIFFITLYIATMYGGIRNLSWLWWPVPGIATYFYSKAKAKYPRGFFRHCMYFIGIEKLEGYPAFVVSYFME